MALCDTSSTSPSVNAGSSGGSADNEPQAKRTKTSGDAMLDDLIIQRDKAEAAMNLFMQEWKSAQVEKTKDFLRDEYKAAQADYRKLRDKVIERQKQREVQPPQAFWRVTVRINRAFQVASTRRNVYDAAMTTAGLRVEGAPPEPIRYVKHNDLFIDVLFENKGNATSFETILIRWNEARDEAYRQMKDRVTDIKVNRTDDLPAGAKLVRIKVSQYQHTKDDPSDDPDKATSFVSVTLERKLQMLEIEQAIPAKGKLEKLHIVPAKCGGRAKPNNLIYATSVFHEHYDGINKEPSNTPTLAVYPAVLPRLQPPTIERAPFNNHTPPRYELDVVVEFFDEEVKNSVLPNLKYPQQTDDNLKAIVKVYPQDPIKYSENLMTKARMTFNVWKSHGWETKTLDRWEADNNASDLDPEDEDPGSTSDEE